MATQSTLKVLGDCQISPPAGSAPSTSLPLTFLDIVWLGCCPMKRLFFYEFPQSICNSTGEYFLQTIVPNLKHSLSLTLGFFYPFAGHLICPLPPNEPHLRYVDGDSIPFMVAQSGADFDQLVSDQPQDVKNLHPLLPQLPPTLCDEEGTRTVPLMTIQVTLFSGRGYSIGFTFKHIVADGVSFHHFLKIWASICANKSELTFLEESSLPFYDRKVIRDPKNLKQCDLNQWWEMTDGAKQFEVEDNDDALSDKVRATFSLSRSQIENLKKRVSLEYEIPSKESEKAVNFSSFVVICALFWVCMVKSEQDQNNVDSIGESVYHLCFSADYRKRNCEFSVPTYFGNCLGVCYSSLKRKELLGDNAILEASKAIRNTILELNDDPLKGVENCVSKFRERGQTGHLITVAGSPNLSVYETDFGWGRPKKSEVVHIDVAGSISHSDARDGGGAAEVAVALGRTRMNSFILVLDESLKSKDINVTFLKTMIKTVSNPMD